MTLCQNETPFEVFEKNINAPRNIPTEIQWLTYNTIISETLATRLSFHR